MKRKWALVVLCLAARAGMALGPHEILLLVNGDSEDSVRIAEEYAELRKVPPANVVRLRTGWTNAAPLEIAPEEFRDRIWLPAAAASDARGIADHVLAWVYSSDFPVRIRADPPVSMTGLTFLRNRLPEAESVQKGTWASPIYMGPDTEMDRGKSSQSLDELALWLGQDMPLPAMMLGYTGPRGNSVQEIMDALRRGAESDGTRPTGTVFFAVDDNVRSRCRSWQFGPARQELARRRVASAMTDRVPTNRPGVLGVMLGMASAPTGSLQCAPGCLIENLTSFGAAFEEASQTKATDWIRSGATAASGAVAEPFSIWTKFPAARLFVHYAWGCTAVESYYLATRCPLQLLILGDPLAQPWREAGRVWLEGLETAPLQGAVRLSARAAPGQMLARYLWLVDGRRAGESTDGRFTLQTGGLAPGEHTVRVVACGYGAMRQQYFDEKPFTVAARAATR